MEKQPWRGLVKILEVEHRRGDTVVWRAENLLNTLHDGGEQFMLACCFDNDGTMPPANYYFGLDNRTTLSVANTMASLVDEPVGNGYLRAAVSSAGGFTPNVLGGVHRATCQIVTFSATGTGWGPVSNLFLTTKADGSGFLLASSPLSNPVTLVAGDSISMRMAVALKDTP